VFAPDASRLASECDDFLVFVDAADGLRVAVDGMLLLFDIIGIEEKIFDAVDDIDEFIGDNNGSKLD
jgi:hypothetical protein